MFAFLSEDLKNVRIPLTIDTLGMVPNSTKIVDLMEILKGCAQRQIQELARTGKVTFEVLTLFKCFKN